ncbi:MAG: efflux RND transporter permease subunit [Kofleriaceae bacterium]|nr:efflux RND transporter permease subunit [Kofleriaceae bacterium]
MLAMFVRRPVLAIVISLLLSLLGGLALLRMPMELFPSVAPPEVNVTIDYTGANAETVTKAALVPLERAINGVPGMKYMSSLAGNDGVGVVQILFEAGTDPDVAAINVQNRVNSVIDELPEEVLRNGVKVAKEENSMLMYVSIHSSNPEHDEKFLYNFADINLLGELKRIPGVGFVDILGAKDYAIRVWIEPEKLLAYDLSVDEVAAALKAYNLEAAPGKLGENSDRGTAPLQYTLAYTGKFNTPEQYARIPLRATPDGRLLRLGDVATIELGSMYFDVETKFDGRPAAALVLKQLPGSNAREVIARVKARLADIQAQAFLPGMVYDVSFDVSRFLDASVHEVQRTLIEAFVLVALVVFVFLQSLRATLIPILAVPVSLVGTLMFALQLGFSLNLITLFALVLAIGIVVDNAIVVVEAVHGKIEHDKLPPKQAAAEAIVEIGPAIIAITLVMAAVFVPLAFIDGPAGIFYRQFALTTTIAIVLSGVVALTLTPALCGLLMTGHAPSGTSRLERVFGGFNRGYLRVEGAYAAVARLSARHRLVPWILIAGFVIGGAMVAAKVPTGFIPNEDQGMFYVSVTTPPGATLERTKEVVDAIAVAAAEIPEVESIATLAGKNVLSDGTGASYGTSLVNLTAWERRDRSVDAIIDDLTRRTAHIKDANLEMFPPPPVPGYGDASGFELRLLDKTGRGNIHEMQRVVTQFVADLKARPEIATAFTIFDATYPQYTIRLDIDQAARLGVTPERALRTLQTLLGSEYATNFIRFGQMYKVMIQAPPGARVTPEQLLNLRVRSEHGALVAMSTFMKLEKTYGVDALTRYNMYPSAELNGEGKLGVSSGDVLAAVQEVANTKLPRGYAIDWAGISRDEIDAGNQGMVVGLLALLFVWLVLAAQYENFLLPVAVLLSLPPGLFGAFGLLHGLGLENNIYTHIALVVLIGLLGKNAILIIEYAELRLAEGRSPREAVVEAARQRLRPILMTSLAFIAGLVPLALATGAGAVANRTIGVATIGGMAMGTVWGIVIVPGLYVACKHVSRWFGARGERLPTAEAR